MKQQHRFIVDTLFVLALFGIFTFSALILVIIGAESYRRTVSNMDSNYETRTAVAYITEKVRQNDLLYTSSGSNTNSVALTTLSGEPALTLTQNINGEIYYSYIFFHDGYLKELLVPKGIYLGNQALSAGQEIMELSTFEMEQLSNNLLSMQLTTNDGKIHQFLISTHCTTN